MGKNIVFMPECHSTNTLALQLCQQRGTSEGTVIITNNQTQGKGQRGNSWEAQPNQNLTFSIILKPSFLKASEQFQLNRSVSLGLYDFLSEKVSTAIKIKWPNDMVVQNRKVCGILIENVIQGSSIAWSVVGIGLNVNQTEFVSERAGSIRMFTNLVHDLDQELTKLLTCVEVRYLALRQGKQEQMNMDYRQALLGIDEKRKFKSQGQEVEGMIKGVDAVGRLMLQTDQGDKVFDIKEIEFVY
jgi:BirA family transcriptional regulator, biotin operon repressor / biotin---[acetyl-CoA-carboxylase] ligase